MADSATLAALRARIRELEGARVSVRRAPSGVPELDALLGGLPCPGVVELAGPVGVGRSRLAFALAVAAQREPEAEVAWVDPQRRLYPPAAALAGVALARLLLVRPPGEHLVWATEQVIRAGCFRLVVVADPGEVGVGAQRWARAAEAGETSVIVLSERPSRALPADVRVQVGPGGLAVSRDRSGSGGRVGPAPAPPAAVDPWQGPPWEPWPARAGWSAR